MYTSNMYLGKLFSKIKKTQSSDEMIVHTLYQLSNGSLFVLILLATLTTFAFYPILSYKIIVWFICIVAISGYRLYLAYLFTMEPEKYSLKVWYKKFVINALVTALIFSTLGFIFINQVEHYYQMYIVALILGMASGSIVSLSSDIKLYIAYATILMFPLTVTVLFNSDMPLNFIVTISLILYFLAQMITIIKIYIQKNEFDLLQSEHLLLDSLFKNAPLGIFTYNKDLEVLESNDQLNKLFEHTEEGITGLNLRDLPDQRVVGSLKNAITQGPQSYVGPYTSLNGKDFWVDAKAFSFSNSSGW